MDLREFPMDHQSCPLVLGSCKKKHSHLINDYVVRIMRFSLLADSYTAEDLIYEWDEAQGVKFLGDVELSQFDLISSPYRNASISRKKGTLLKLFIRRT